jgi:hypothetical protein
MLQFWNILYCRWKKTSDNRKFIVEKQDIRSLRIEYLRAIKAYRKEERSIVYTDETYIHSSHTTSYAWDDGSGAGLKAPISKGRRLIIVHAGNSTLYKTHTYHYSNNGFLILNKSVLFKVDSEVSYPMLF